jgi:hypothetical protein
MDDVLGQLVNLNLVLHGWGMCVCVQDDGDVLVMMMHLETSFTEGEIVSCRSEMQIRR